MRMFWEPIWAIHVGRHILRMQCNGCDLMNCTSCHKRGSNTKCNKLSVPDTIAVPSDICRPKDSERYRYSTPPAKSIPTKSRIKSKPLCCTSSYIIILPVILVIVPNQKYLLRSNPLFWSVRRVRSKFFEGATGYNDHFLNLFKLQDHVLLKIYLQNLMIDPGWAKSALQDPIKYYVLDLGSYSTRPW